MKASPLPDASAGGVGGGVVLVSFAMSCGALYLAVMVQAMAAKISNL